MFVFFFFKQKTAYEMRISDWSSDVCSSDLGLHRRNIAAQGEDQHRQAPSPAGQSVRRGWGDRQKPRGSLLPASARSRRRGRSRPVRSEEHTSELQSLMRISYAVFCLKIKTNHDLTLTAC